ncbi:MAG: hypothetical protein FVQ82_00775 [Planctomycetes bacterium]|nr:hypothetical protein [Planctomycetota bacterium]
MLSIDKLKSFISHPDKLVREKIMNYISRGSIKDPEILPMALDAFEKCNDAKELHLLYHCREQYIDDVSAERLVQILQNTDDELIEMHTANLLCNANLSWLEKNIARLKSIDLISCDHLNWRSADSRLEFKNHSPYQLWDRFNEYAAQCDKDYESYLPYYVDAIIEALTPHSFPDDDKICDLLKSESGHDRYLEVFLVALAGARKINRAVPLICDMLTDDDSNASDWCIAPLSLIGSTEVITVFKEQFPQQSWSYQMTVVDILSYIKTPESEQAIIELLRQKDCYDEDVYYSLCFAICDQLSEKAIDLCTPFIDEPEACQIGSFREELLAIAQIHGIDLPQAAEWRQQVADDYEMKFRKMSNFGEMSQGFRDKVDQMIAQKRIAEINEDLRETDNHRQGQFEIKEYDPPVFVSKLQPSNKVGRNEPCPCDSGKKYKKCCGASD